MPQFDTAFWVSQVFWLLISFGGLYLGVSFIAFPMFSKIFKKRAEQIEVPFEKAEMLVSETQEMQSKLEQKKQDFYVRQNQRLATVQQQKAEQLQMALEKQERELSGRLKRHIQKLEHAEKQLVADSDFARQMLKGIR